MEKKLNILIIDDQIIFSDTLKESLQINDYNVSQAFTGESALEILYNNEIDMCFLDVYLPDINGFNLVEKIRKISPDCEIVVMTTYQEGSYIKKALKKDIYFLTKPFKISDLDNVLKKVEKKLHIHRIKTYKKTSKYNHPYLQFKGKKHQNIIPFLDSIAKSDLPILITGEPATGKHNIAKYIHYNSSRKNDVFITFNPHLLPEYYIEKDCFGHGNNRSILEIANNGTLYIPHFDDLNHTIQLRILEIMENNSVIIDNKQIEIDIRFIVSAYNTKNISEKVLHKIGNFNILIPPLRDRLDDFDIFIESILKHWGIDIKDFDIDKSAYKLLKKYNWPNNFIELENVIKKAVLLSDGKRLTIDTLPLEIINYEHGKIEKTPSLKDVERQYIMNILYRVKNNKAKAARLLGIDRKTLYRKMEKYNIQDTEEV